MKNIGSLLLIAAIVILAVVGLVVTQQKQPQQTTPTQPPPKVEQTKSTVETVPDLTLTDYGGKKVRLSDFRGKPLIINSWAAWCPFCRDELPDFSEIQKELGDRVVIIAVDRAESRDVAKKYTDELGVTGDFVFLLDPQDSFYKAIGGFSMPETIFATKDGKVVDHKRGVMEKEEIKARAKKIL
ncbi:TlpA family protein disulfide reductase [Candidatus Roizmanbacteria bacterium]|nr:TlpA family protein disulfide reductase [Candidatus Roizmanbacteria bacterium]